jgi:hypothetical protein
VLVLRGCLGVSDDLSTVLGIGSTEYRESTTVQVGRTNKITGLLERGIGFIHFTHVQQSG